MPQVAHPPPQNIKKPLKTNGFLTFSEMQHMQQNDQKMLPKPETAGNGKRKQTSCLSFLKKVIEVVRNSLEWLGIIEVVVKVYISEGEFSQIFIEFLEMLFTFSNLLGSSSSSSFSNSSNPFSFSKYFCASSFICSGYSCSANWDPRVLLILISVAVLLAISIFLFFKFIQFF